MQDFTGEAIKGEFGSVGWDQMCMVSDHRTAWQSQVALQVTSTVRRFSLAGAGEERTPGE